MYPTALQMWLKQHLFLKLFFESSDTFAHSYFD